MPPSCCSGVENGITDTDAAQPHADEDRAQEDDDLKNNHDTHKIFPINLGLRLVMQQSALGMERPFLIPKQA